MSKLSPSTEIHPGETMKVHDSEHWMNGGTGLTNFPGHQFPIYLESVRRHGNPAFLVSSTRMLGRGRDADGGSLHYTGKMRCEEGSAACGAFWEVFYVVKEEMRDVYDKAAA